MWMLGCERGVWGGARLGFLGWGSCERSGGASTLMGARFVLVNFGVWWDERVIVLTALVVVVFRGSLEDERSWVGDIVCGSKD